MEWGTTLHLPYMINLMGLIIPIQGSFIYFVALLKAKYKLSIVNMSANYLWLFALELTIDGFIGLIFILIYNAIDFRVFAFFDCQRICFFYMPFDLYLLKSLQRLPDPICSPFIRKVKCIGK